MTTITISKSEFLSRLQSVSKIISSKPSTPILGNILLDIQDGVIKVSAADSLGRINTSIDGILTDTNVSICVEPKLLIDALGSLPEQPIDISISDSLGITINYKGGKFEMIGQPADQFPEEKSIKGATKLLISSKVLLNGIERIIFCAANDELRPIMNGVYFDAKEGIINFVASDGHKLALLEHTDTSIGQEISFVLPQKIALIIKKMFPVSDDMVNIFIGTNTVRLEYGSESIVATLLEGRFPNYRSVIPQNNDKNLTVIASDFKGAIKRVSVFSNPASSLVKLELLKDQIKLSAQDIEYSTAADETVTCEYDNKSLAIGFKGHFLTELISAISTAELQMSFSDPQRASLITPVDDKSGDKLTYLLMPMMLAD